MSFNDRFDRWNRLTQMDPEARLAEFRKRFDDFGADKPLFADRPMPRMGRTFANRWPDMNTQSQRPDNDGDDMGIPIKVIHEKPDDRNDRPKSQSSERNGDHMSSNASHKSNESSRTGVSGASAASSGSVFEPSASPMDTDSPASQPKVHHIPIRVEPRTGSASSGYTSSENNANTNHPLSRSSSHSSAKSADGGVGHVLRNEKRSPSPANSVSSAHSMNSTKSTNSVKSNHSGNQMPVDEHPIRVHQIPIKVEHNNSSNKPSVSTNNSKNNSKNANNKTKSGPFVTRIPVSQQTTEDETTPEAKTIQTPVQPLDQINLILTDLKKLEIKVAEFKGCANDKQYRYLDEMLTRCMIKLDTIETEGDETLRKARKEAIVAVHKCITLLEQKCDNNNNQIKEEPMEVTSTTGPNGETIDEQTESAAEVVKEEMDTNECVAKDHTEANDKCDQQKDVNTCGQSVDKIQSNSQTNSQPKETAV